MSQNDEILLLLNKLEEKLEEKLYKTEDKRVNNIIPDRKIILSSQMQKKMINWKKRLENHLQLENVIEKKKKECLECSICYERMEDGEKNTVITKCGHKFCLSCLLMHLSKDNRCPLCREDIEEKRQKTVNLLTPIMAHEIINDELEYLNLINIVRQIVSSNKPVRDLMSALRSYGMGICNNIAHYVHEGNVPNGWNIEEEESDEELVERSQDTEDNNNDGIIDMHSVGNNENNGFNSNATLFTSSMVTNPANINNIHFNIRMMGGAHMTEEEEEESETEGFESDSSMESVYDE